MALTVLEIIALIFVLLAIIKIIVVLINKQAWFKNVQRPIFENKSVSTFVFAILTIILFYFLLQELNIVQIFVAMVLSGIITGLGFLLYSKELIPVFEKIVKKNLTGAIWIYLILWIILLLWVLYDIFLL